jgi:hypothetical protein
MVYGTACPYTVLEKEREIPIDPHPGMCLNGEKRKGTIEIKYVIVNDDDSITCICKKISANSYEDHAKFVEDLEGHGWTKREH